MEAFVPVREPRGPAGASWALVPVRLGPFVPVLGTNRDQWASLLAHNHWSRFVAGTGTEGWPLVPIPATNRDKCVVSIYPIAGEQSTLLCFLLAGEEGHLGALAHLLCM